MIEKREKALFKIAMEEPEMCEMIKMLQENDMRNANATNNVAHALEYVTDRTLNSLEKMSDTMNEMSNAMKMMGNKIVELEEKIVKLEEKFEELEEGDNMDKTVEMCNNVVESIKKSNDDDFLASYMELTAALKAEVQQDTENEKEYGDDIMENVENIYSEMTYGDATTKVLCDGQYKGFNYWILNIRGSHPCGYIEIPEDHEYYEEDYDDVYLPVHGGLTFSEDHLNGIVEDTWILGWDYGHYGDRTTSFGGEEHYVKDIIEEIKEAIDFLISQ